MRLSVREVAAAVGGRVVGDADAAITGINSLSDAGTGDLSFLANPKYAPLVAETRAAAVLMAEPLAADHPAAARVAQIVVANPDLAFARAVAAFGPRPQPPRRGVHPTAVVGDRVHLGADVCIGPYVVVGDGCAIGDRSVLHAHVVVGHDTVLGADNVLYPQSSVRERCRLGDRVILHNGAVVGSDGFGYATQDGVHHKIPQVGTVEIGDDVEVGANSCIDRARFGRTRIGAGTKIDNLVQIAHNVELGPGCIVVAQTGIAGSSRVGSYVTFAGQSGVSGHLTIGDRAIVTGQAGVTKSLPAAAVVRGCPAQDIKVFQAQEIAVRRLPRVLAQFKQLEARLAELERRLGERP